MNSKAIQILTKSRNTALALFDKNEKVIVHYSRSSETVNNFGDALNGYLIPLLSGKPVEHHQSIYNLFGRDVYTAIGSILGPKTMKGLQIWGSGFKKDPGCIKHKPKKVWAVRGKLTRDVFIRNDVPCPEIYGDPGILISDFYQPKRISGIYDLGIIPHYIDKNNPVLKTFAGRENIKLIDIEQGIENFVNEVTSCKKILSSSLHGLICAAAYEIPHCWIKLSDKISGGDFKFIDYYSSFLEMECVPKPLHLDPNFALKDIADKCKWIDYGPKKDPIYQSCPFRK